MNDAAALLQKLLTENHLTVQLSNQSYRELKDGALLIEKPQLVVNFEQGYPKTEVITPEVVPNV
jgi:hypothetical protein